MDTTAVPLIAADLTGAVLSLALAPPAATGPGESPRASTEYDFTAAVVQALFVPTPDWKQVGTWPADGNVVAQGNPKWTVQVTYVQSFAPGSLARYLFEHTGATAAARFVLAAGQALTVDVTLQPGTFGGVIGELPLASVELPCWDAPKVVD